MDGCSLLTAEGFFCNLEVLYGGLRDLYIVVSDKKIVFFSSIFGHQNPGSGLDPDQMNADPQPYLLCMSTGVCTVLYNIPVS